MLIRNLISRRKSSSSGRGGPSAAAAACSSAGSSPGLAAGSVEPPGRAVVVRLAGREASEAADGVLPGRPVAVAPLWPGAFAPHCDAA